ncbi:MAG: hypothetical protein ACRC41_05960 [Sarcina sp.]
MGYFKILFRNSSDIVPFKSSLGELIRSEGVYLVITSGYFGDIIINPDNVKFFENAFRNWIENSISNTFYMDFYGGQTDKYKKDNDYKATKDSNGEYILDDNYKNFQDLANYFKKLGEDICQVWNKKNNGNKKFLMRAGYSSNKFHAKMAMKFQSFDYYNTLTQVIIGSSNLTRPAFNSPNKYYNFESDIYMYKKKEVIDTIKIEDYIINNISKNDVLAFRIDDDVFKHIGEKAIDNIYNIRENNEMDMLDL